MWSAGKKRGSAPPVVCLTSHNGALHIIQDHCTFDPSAIPRIEMWPEFARLPHSRRTNRRCVATSVPVSYHGRSAGRVVLERLRSVAGSHTVGPQEHLKIAVTVSGSSARWTRSSATPDAKVDLDGRILSTDSSQSSIRVGDASASVPPAPISGEDRRR